MLLTAARAQSSPADVLAKAIELHRANDVPGALTLYREYLRQGPPSFDAYTNFGAALAHEGQYGEAIAAYRQALAINAGHPPALLNLALAFYKTGRISEAREHLTRVRPLIPPNVQVLLLLADCDVRLGDDKAAIELLTPLAGERPDDLAVAYVLGTALLRDKQTDRAAQIIDRILRRGDSAEAHLLIGTAKFNVNDFAGARDEFRRAAELNPKLPDVHAYLGLSLLNIGETAAAGDAFRQELDQNPANFTALLQLGVLTKQAQRNDEARRLFERAFAARPGDAAVRYQLATVDLASGRVEEARQALESLIKDTPNFREAHVTLAAAYYRLKRKEDGDRERAIVRQLTEAEQARDASSAPR